MSASDKIDYLLSASWICFGIAIAAAVLAIALFFLLDIREIFLIETGRARRKTVEEMHARNQRTGKLRDDTEADLNTKERSASGSAFAERTASHEESTGQQGSPLQNTVPVTGSSAGSATEAYRNPAMPPDANGQFSGRQDDSVSIAGGHRGGVKQQESRAAPGFMFHITKKTIITHTDERIPM